MADGKKNQSKQFSELFSVFIEEFGPVAVDVSEQFLKSRSQHSSEEHSSEEAKRDYPGRAAAGSRKQKAKTKDKAKDADDGDTGAASAADAADANSDDDSPENDYADAEASEKQKTGRVHRTILNLVTSEDVLGAMKGLILEAGEVRKFEEAQRTQRADIAARRDVAIASIEAQRAAIQAYLDKSFDERRENFSKLFDVVDHALATDNMQELAMSLQGVLTLAQSSPFKDLQTVEATATALADPDHEWDF